jgi:hypothetical protein
LPEGLILLFGLLSTLSIQPKVRCRCMTLISFWIKSSPENAIAVLKINRWQRWFIGLYSSSLRIFHLSRNNRNHRKKKKDKDNNEKDDDENENTTATTTTDQKKEEGEENEVDECGPIMTTLIIDSLAALYKTLLFDVKRGYEYWSTLHTLTVEMPCGMYFARNVVIATLHRCYSSLSSSLPSSSSCERRLSTSSSLTITNRLADNISATFQFIDERLLGMVSARVVARDVFIF